LNEALDGQTILVGDGVYEEIENLQLDFHGRAITLRSVNGPQACVIKGDGFPDMRAFRFHSGEGADSVVEGFTIRDASASGTTAPDGGQGGGGAIVCENGSSPTIRNCVFLDNISGGFLGESSGGAVVVWNSSPSLINCLFAGNDAIWGSALYAGNANVSLINCTVANNVGGSSGPSSYLGAIGGFGTIGSMANCIVYGNINGAIGAGAPVAVSYSDIEGGWPGVGNIAANPQFVTTSSGPYHLASSSPCIDAASNPAVPRDVTEDLEGNPRFVDNPATIDTGLGRAPIVDMGAYEFNPADLNQDGNVDGFDLGLLLGQWTGAGMYAPCPPIKLADLNGDCKINGIDLAILLAAWG
jgi:hypothetical protein